jgi:hypothetical protein
VDFRSQIFLELNGLIRPLRLAGSPLGCLQGIQFFVCLPIGGSGVGSHIAGPCSPFDGGIRKNEAVFPSGKFSCFLAGFTLLNDGVAVTPIKPTSFLAHEEAFHPFLTSCTNHSNHILSLEFKNFNFLVSSKLG